MKTKIMKTNKNLSCCLYVLKDLDVQNSYFEKNIFVNNSVSLKNSVISNGCLYRNENTKTTYCDLDKSCEKVFEYSYFDRKNYEYCVESIRLQEINSKNFGEVKNSTLYLKGNDSKQNIFTFKYSDIYNSKKNFEDILQVNISVPENSCIVINIIGAKVILNCLDIYVNGQEANEKTSFKLIWNFPETSFFACNFSKLFGFFLLPFATVKVKNCSIYGFLVSRILKGNCKIYYRNCIDTSIITLCDDYSLDFDTNCDTNSSTVNCCTTYCTTTTLPTTTCTTYCCTTYDCNNNYKQAYIDVIESIALEEAGLSHIINAEGEKIQKALEIAETTDDLLKINQSVKRTLATVNHSQMLLQFKLDEVQRQFKKY